MRQVLIYYSYMETALVRVRRDVTVDMFRPFGLLNFRLEVSRGPSKRTPLASLTATCDKGRCTQTSGGCFRLNVRPWARSRSTLAAPSICDWLGEKRRRSFHFANWKSYAETEHQTDSRSCVRRVVLDLFNFADQPFRVCSVQSHTNGLFKTDCI